MNEKGEQALRKMIAIVLVVGVVSLLWIWSGWVQKRYQSQKKEPLAALAPMAASLSPPVVETTPPVVLPTNPPVVSPTVSETSPEVSNAHEIQKTSTTPVTRVTNTPEEPEASSPATIALTQNLKKGFYLQVASYQTFDEAKSFIEKQAVELGLGRDEVYIKSVKIPSRGTWFRIYVGPFSSSKESLQLGKTLQKSKKIESYLIAKNP
jgi:cell division septation protein DedD